MKIFNDDNKKVSNDDSTEEIASNDDVISTDSSETSGDTTVEISTESVAMIEDSVTEEGTADNKDTESTEDRLDDTPNSEHHPTQHPTNIQSKETSSVSIHHQSYSTD